jgi:serine/threonine protein kinase
LKRFIGKGVFAYVFSAWDTFENREVALKIFRRHPVYQDTGFEERKILEHISQQQRKLGENKGDTCDGVKKNDYDNDDDNDDEDGNEVYHTSGRHNQNHYFHIVPCLDAFYTPDRLCLVFPCHSHNLRQLCRYTNGRGIQLHQVQRIAKQLLVALDFLSKPSVDIIHADLKPENIVLEKQRNVVNVQLLDFGNSRRRHEATERGYIQTLWYRSPECLLSLPWDQSIDVWSLGCVLFELHKGRPLFYAENEQELALSIEKLMGRFPPSMVEASPERFSLFKQYNDRVKKDDGTTARGRPLYLVNHPRKHQGERPKLSYVKDLRTNLCAHRGGLDKKNADKNIDKMMTAYELFIDFLHHMLEYHPTDRSTPKELLRHPFLSFEM